MAWLTGLGAAVVALLVLYVALDAGPVAAAPGTSPALVGLGLLFAAGAWGFRAGGRGGRSPAMAGLAAALVAYGLLRMLLL